MKTAFSLSRKRLILKKENARKLPLEEGTYDAIALIVRARPWKELNVSSTADAS